jgi:hypothetical protein
VVRVRDLPMSDEHDGCWRIHGGEGIAERPNNAELNRSRCRYPLRNPFISNEAQRYTDSS